jgi:hypothetical protein
MRNQDCPIMSGMDMPRPPNLHLVTHLCLYQNTLGLDLLVLLDVLLGGVIGISSRLACLILLRTSENTSPVINCILFFLLLSFHVLHERF